MKIRTLLAGLGLALIGPNASSATEENTNEGHETPKFYVSQAYETEDEAYFENRYINQPGAFPAQINGKYEYVFPATGLEQEVKDVLTAATEKELTVDEIVGTCHDFYQRFVNTRAEAEAYVDANPLKKFEIYETDGKFFIIHDDTESRGTTNIRELFDPNQKIQATLQYSYQVIDIGPVKYFENKEDTKVITSKLESLGIEYKVGKLENGNHAINIDVPKGTSAYEFWQRIDQLEENIPGTPTVYFKAREPEAKE